MKVTLEVETTLSVPVGFTVPAFTEVAGVASVVVRQLLLQATYYDTADVRLARGHATLRHRTGEGAPCWTLKLTPASGPGRDEHTVVGPGTAVPAVLTDLLTARLRGAPVHPAVELTTRRTSSLLLDAAGRELVEVADDLVKVAGGQTWRELEVELKGDAQQVASRVLDLLCSAGAHAGDQSPKAVRALGPAAAGPPDLPAPVAVRRKDPAGALVQWCLRDGLRRLIEHDVGVRRDREDAVHQVRVTCRRLRSDLRTYRPLLADPRAEQLRGELAWLADSFGAARDLEVLRGRLVRTASELPQLDVAAVDQLLAAEHDAALGQSLEALRSSRYLRLLDLLHELASAPMLTPLADGRCDHVLPGIVAQAWKKLDQRARHLQLTGEDAPWHRARILAKRARYAAENAAVALGKDVRPQAKAAKKVQTILGEHQDAAMAERAALDLAEAHPRDVALAVLCGRLAERERRHVGEVRRRFLAQR